jgi:molybdopterin/thiamine biosynthesis adenylyltransferase
MGGTDGASRETGPRHVLVRAAQAGRLRGEGRVAFELRDDGDLAVIGVDGGRSAPVVTAAVEPEEVPRSVEPEAELVLFVPPDGGRPGAPAPIAAFAGRAEARRRIGVTVEPAHADVFDRLRGLFESDALREKCIVLVGCGSGGSIVLRELVRSGVGKFVLVDHDRLELANVCRHELGLADIGRLKVNALRDYVLDRNPQANVTAEAFKLDGGTFDRLHDLVRSAAPDLIVCGTDNRESRLLINRAALLTDTVALYGGVRRRAYAGQVLRVIPGLTPCYQCFIKGLPDVVLDAEISSQRDADRVAYSDRPVTPEPGLSTDIAPVALMMAKLALVELTYGHESSIFESQRQDLAAPWFFWLNRREADTPFADWPPLHDRMDGPGVLRWIGQFLDRDPRCSACGSGLDDVAVTADEIARFSEDPQAVAEAQHVAEVQHVVEP